MSVFTRQGAAYVPTGHAVGPWDPGALHGGAPGALLTREVAALAPEMQVARLTFEILGPVPRVPLLCSAQVTRPGRRFQVAEGELTTPDDRVAMRVRAVLLRRGDVPLPGGAGEEEPVPAPPPAECPPAARWSDGEGFHLTGMELRDAGGTWSGRGAARTWFRMPHDLVEGEGPARGPELAVAAADFSNGISHCVPFDRYLFINTDLTVHLHREPEGAWVLSDARSRAERGGAGLAWTRLHDERGPVGLAAQSLFVDVRG